jgi:NhaP-type Na+/H+ or K+/H+ antiporter
LFLFRKEPDCTLPEPAVTAIIMSGGGHEESTAHHVLFTLFCALLLGAALRHKLAQVKIPYTVVLLLLGIAIGAIGRSYDGLEGYLSIVDIDPHLMLFTFLPVLLFESSFSLDIHIFKRSLGSIVVLAMPGVLIATALTATVWHFAFPYDFTFAVALLLGAILSATDPVAVVALLRDLGASPVLATLIEGESLLNDGTAIVLYLVLQTIVKDQAAHREPNLSVWHFAYEFFYVAFGGPAVGYVFGKVSVYWLSKVYNDALVEITITLGMTYCTFFVAEEFLGVSGVLAVVMLGLYMNAVGRTRISHEVEHFLHRFYEMLGYLANTLIFLLCGMVAAYKTDFTWKDMAYLLLLYVVIHVVRGASIAMLAPFLRHMGYGMTLETGLVITYGGLRGGVGLALAILVSLDIGGEIGSMVMFYTAGIVVLTLLINGTTIRYLLDVLGMNELSSYKYLMIRNSVVHMRHEARSKLSTLKRDPFLGEADWNTVRDYWYYPHLPRPPGMEQLSAVRKLYNASTNACSKLFCCCFRERAAVAPHNNEHDMEMFKAEASLRNETGDDSLLPDLQRQFSGVGADELDSMREKHLMKMFDKMSNNATITDKTTLEDAELGLHTIKKKPKNLSRARFESATRHRYMRALKQSFWHQFEEGLLGERAVLLLIHAVDDCTDRNADIVAFGDISEHMVLPSKLEQLYDQYSSVPVVGSMLRSRIYRRLFIAFHVGMGYIRAQTDLERLIKSHLTSKFSIEQDQNVVKHTLALIEVNKDLVLNALFDIRNSHPEIAVAVKTVFAATDILNHQRKTVEQLLGTGAMEEDEANKLLSGIETCMRSLHFSKPRVQPPSAMDLLSENPLFHGLGESIVRDVADAGKQVGFEEGQFIAEENKPSDGCVLIISGLVRISSHGVEITTAGPGTMLGEMSLLRGGDHKSSVRASSYTTVLLLGRDVMQRVMQEHSVVSSRLWEYATFKQATSMLSGQYPYSSWRQSVFEMWIQTGRFVEFSEAQSGLVTIEVPYVCVLYSGSVETQEKNEQTWSPPYHGPHLINGPCMVRPLNDPKMLIFDFPSAILGNAGFEADYDGPPNEPTQYENSVSASSDDSESERSSTDGDQSDEKASPLKKKRTVHLAQVPPGAVLAPVAPKRRGVSFSPPETHIIPARPDTKRSSDSMHSVHSATSTHSQRRGVSFSPPETHIIPARPGAKRSSGSMHSVHSTTSTHSQSSPRNDGHRRGGSTLLRQSTLRALKNSVGDVDFIPSPRAVTRTEHGKIIMDKNAESH